MLSLPPNLINFLWKQLTTSQCKIWEPCQSASLSPLQPPGHGRDYTVTRWRDAGRWNCQWKVSREQRWGGRPQWRNILVKGVQGCVRGMVKSEGPEVRHKEQRAWLTSVRQLNKMRSCRTHKALPRLRILRGRQEKERQNPPWEPVQEACSDG